MNKRIAKKKIKHNILVTLWLKNFVINSKAFLKYSELIETDNGEIDLYKNALKVSLDFMKFDLENAHKVVANSIRKTFFLKIIDELLKTKRYN